MGNAHCLHLHLLGLTSLCVPPPRAPLSFLSSSTSDSVFTVCYPYTFSAMIRLVLYSDQRRDFGFSAPPSWDVLSSYPRVSLDSSLRLRYPVGCRSFKILVSWLPPQTPRRSRTLSIAPWIIIRVGSRRASIRLCIKLGLGSISRASSNRQGFASCYESYVCRCCSRAVGLSG